MKRAPRVAAVHDMSGVGRCSLTVILPVLAAMGCQCNPMLTAYLSAHTAFPASEHAVFLDMTYQMGQVAAHWGELGVEPDAVYSGFLGSERQIGLLQTAICRFRREKTLVLVDPVMGDHGRAYRTCTPALCARMGELAAQAVSGDPELALSMMKYLARTVRLLSEQLDAMAFRPAEWRIARYLLSHSPSGGTVQCTQEDIAAAVSVSRVTVSRILNRWAHSGTVALQYRSILLRDPSALEQLCRD